MYTAFDSFLNGGNWFSSHKSDEDSFYRVLQSVVRDPDFAPETMGRYMREQKGVTEPGTNAAYESAIDDLVSKAWAVKDYLRVTGE